ncbi:MAG: 4'-phosphopantetheinyl transferase superfamily protein [Bacteroidales bacterium]|nr:4'-phosphopantetheinyl transferase superfamily protein [Bacteroidales bacterium]
MIYRYRAGLEQYDEAKMAECLSWFPQERVDNILKINHLQGRREKAAAYELLVEMMREEGCLKQLPLFQYDENGKPHLSNYPSLHFNISHCKKAVAVALHHAEVGIDIECRRPVSQALMERVCCAEELSLIRSSADAELEFIRLWTRKEALLKCTGVGIREDLREILSYYTDYKIITEYIAEIDGYLSVCVK